MSCIEKIRSASDRGATATEYALLVGFIALALIGGITVFGGALDDWFSNLAGDIGALL